MDHYPKSLLEKLEVAIFLVLAAPIAVIMLFYMLGKKVLFGEENDFERPEGLNCVSLIGSCDEQLFIEVRKDIVERALESSHMTPDKIVVAVEQNRGLMDRLESLGFEAVKTAGRFEKKFEYELLEAILADPELYSSLEDMFILNQREEVMLEKSYVSKEGGVEAVMDMYLSLDQARKADKLFLEKYGDRRLNTLHLSY